jgi:hypothetical protein
LLHVINVIGLGNHQINSLRPTGRVVSQNSDTFLADAPIPGTGR